MNLRRYITANYTPLFSPFDDFSPFARQLFRMSFDFGYPTILPTPLSTCQPSSDADSRYDTSVSRVALTSARRLSETFRRFLRHYIGTGGGIARELPFIIYNSRLYGRITLR